MIRSAFFYLTTNKASLVFSFSLYLLGFLLEAPIYLLFVKVKLFNVNFRFISSPVVVSLFNQEQGSGASTTCIGELQEDRGIGKRKSRKFD